MTIPPSLPQAHQQELGISLFLKLKTAACWNRLGVAYKSQVVDFEEFQKPVSMHW